MTPDRIRCPYCGTIIEATRYFRDQSGRGFWDRFHCPACPGIYGDRPEVLELHRKIASEIT